MKIYLGETGLHKTWQEPFLKTIKCHKCKKNAKIMFVGFEDDDEEYICNLQRKNRKKGELFVHDCIAIAIYLCPFCFEITGEMNQA